MKTKSDITVICRLDGVETRRRVFRYVINKDKNGEFIRWMGNKKYIDRSITPPSVYSDARTIRSTPFAEILQGIRPGQLNVIMASADGKTVTYGQD